MSRLAAVFDFIDNLNEIIGTVLCLGLLALIGIQDFEVIMRYIFNNPTSWAGDMNGMLFTGMAMIAGAYALRHGIHVRLDILYRTFSPKKKAMVELISFPFVLAALIIVLWQGLDMAWWSFTTDEKAYSRLAPLLWPVKSCLPLAALLMILQSFSTYGRVALSLIHPEQKSEAETESGPRDDNEEAVQ